jgi:steroid delta-isomerase-like uncharacterized protein
MDGYWKLELVTVPVSDVDRAKAFYMEQAGFTLHVDHRAGEDFRVVQLTPAGSSCSIALMTSAERAGSLRGLHLVVADIEAAREELSGRGVEVSEVFHFEAGRQMPGPDPERRDYGSFMSFADPDGNGWLVQEVRPSEQAPAGLAELGERIAAYNDAWNAHDVELIVSMHAPGMVFENHTAGERAEGKEVRAHIARIFESWPDLTFETRRLYLREDLVVQEWTARATHVKPLTRGEIVAEPSGRRIEWNGMDVIPFEDGRVLRKDVYSDSVSILQQVGLL